MTTLPALSVLIVVGLGAMAPGSPASEVPVDVGTGVRLRVPVRSFKDLRDDRVVRQTLDYSCGAAALATLLTYGLGEPATEAEVLAAVFSSVKTTEEIDVRKKQGLSLLDLQRVAEARGFKAQGFRLGAAFLSRLRGPVIVFIRPEGYEHFAVLKGVRGDRAYLADPSRGNVRMPLSRFRRMWVDEHGRGILFAVEPVAGGFPSSHGLVLPEPTLPRPEVLSARELLEIGTRLRPIPSVLSR